MLFWRFWLAGPGWLIEYHHPVRYVTAVPLTKFTRGPPEFPCFPVKTWNMRQRQPHQWFWHQSPKEKRCSTGAHVDYGIRLDVADVRLYAQLPAVSLGGADDAGGDRVLQGKRAADRNHKFPWSQISWPAQSQHGKLLLLWNREAESQRQKNWWETFRKETDGGKQRQVDIFTQVSNGFAHPSSKRFSRKSFQSVFVLKNPSSSFLLWQKCQLIATRCP